MSESIADLFATFGLQVNAGSFARGGQALTDLGRKVETIQAKSDQAFKALIARGPAAVTGIANAQAAATKATSAGALQALKTISLTNTIGKEAEEAGRKARGAESSFKGLAAAIAGIGAGALAYKGVKTGVDFNASMEDSRTTIAGIMALVKNTSIADEFAQADKTLANLQKRAMTLPGTTEDYVKSLQTLTQPILDAKGSMQQLEDLTVQSVVASRALGVSAEVGARDISQAARGQFHSVDQLTGPVLGAIGYKGEAGRTKFNAMSEQKRLAELVRGFGRKQVDELGVAQGQTFSGRKATLEDNVKLTLGEGTKALFQGLNAALAEMNSWFEQNRAAVNELARDVGSTLVTALNLAMAAFRFVTEHATFFKGALTGLGVVVAGFAARSALAFATAFGPIGVAVTAAGALYSIFGKSSREVADKSAKAGTSVDGLATSITTAAASGDGFEGLNKGLQDVKANADKAATAVKGVTEFKGIDPAKLKADGILDTQQNAGGDEGWVGSIFDAIDWAGDTIGWGEDDLLKGIGRGPKATPSVPAASFGAPQVNVTVTGNMPAGWIDAKIDEKVQAHHDVTWGSASTALQADEEP